MEQLIAVLMLAREVAHRAHLKTTSYAKHMALNDFYNAVGDFADSIAEAYQGQFAVLLEIPMLEAENTTDIEQFLRTQMEWLAQNRYTACPREETAIQNKIDEVVGLYQSTVYKLRFLA